MPLHYTWLAHSTEHLHGLQNITKLGAQRAWGQAIDGYSPTALQLLQPKSEITFALSASYDAVVHFPLALNFLNVMMILASGARIGMKSLIISTTSTGLQFMSHTAGWLDPRFRNHVASARACAVRIQCTTQV